MQNCIHHYCEILNGGHYVIYDLIMLYFEGFMPLLLLVGMCRKAYGKEGNGISKEQQQVAYAGVCNRAGNLTVLYFVHIINDTLFLNCASTIVPVKYHLFC